MQHPFSTRRGQFSARRLTQWTSSWSHLWVLLCVLPMLFMSVVSQTPHEHELRALTTVSAHHHAASSHHAVTATSDTAPADEAQMSLSAVHHGSAVALDCLLCHWAGVALACLAVALTLLWLQLGVLPIRSAPSVVHSFVPLALRSRAPPLAL